MYTLYGTLASRAFRVGWMLEELGVPWELVQAPPHSEAIYSVSSAGKIPALVLDDGTVLTDSVAIMSFLADRHSALTHAPGSPERARQDALLHRLNSDMDGLLWAASLHGRILPEERRVPAVVETLKWAFAHGLDSLAGEFVGPFLMGDLMTPADMLATHCLGWARMAGFPLENETMMAYAKSMTRRDAYRSARARMAPPDS